LPVAVITGSVVIIEPLFLFLPVLIRYFIPGHLVQPSAYIIYRPYIRSAAQLVPYFLQNVFRIFLRIDPVPDKTKQPAAIVGYYLDYILLFFGHYQRHTGYLIRKTIPGDFYFKNIKQFFSGRKR
jgi:hypothetical protein